MPKERFLENVSNKTQIDLHWTKPKIFRFSSDYKNLQKIKLQKNDILMILNATSEYRVVFLYLFWITTTFQRNILFKTNKCHHGGPPWCGGPGAIAPVALPLIRPCAPTLIKPAKHVESTVLTQLEVLCENRNYSVFFKVQFKHFPTIGAKDLIKINLQIFGPYCRKVL